MIEWKKKAAGKKWETLNGSHFNMHFIHFVHVSFPIHDNILATSSKYFNLLLGLNFEEGIQKKIILNDIDGETIKTIVHFCYTGRINITEENVAQLMAISSSIEFDLLEEKCCKFYAEKLNAKNSVDTLLIADEYNKFDLRLQTLNFICDALEMVPSMDVQRLNHRLLQEILQSDNIEATEELVFKRLFEWFEYNGAERKIYMPELLRLIRLENIPTQVCFVKRF